MLLKGLRGFDWDQGNQDKNERKHGVTSIECEEVFFQRPLIVTLVAGRLLTESRYVALGTTRGGRLLCIVFTRRRRKIRVISARPMSRKERIVYEKENHK